MEKLSKRRAAKLAGISVYRLNKDIESGELNTLPSGGICLQSLSRRYLIADDFLVPVEHAKASNQHKEEISTPSGSGVAAEESVAPSRLRLIGKLEALLSLAERHRLMIEQQRRNISMLKAINQRQEREIQQLRLKLCDSESVEALPWRKLFDRFSSAQRT